MDTVVAYYTCTDQHGTNRATDRIHLYFQKKSKKGRGQSITRWKVKENFVDVSFNHNSTNS